ncbi:MAG: thymidylate synthase [Hyphomicrobiaceae bacterium]|nr:thymidylate synthase [Hyphomicrobiaceae bacterium]
MTTSVAPVPFVVEESSVSRAWARAFLRVMDNPGTEISPLVVSIDGFGPGGEIPEDGAMRAAMDAALVAAGERWDVETVAFTIFPERYWRMAQGDRAKFFDLCRRALPRLMAMNPASNRRGLYFGRLVAYGSGPCGGNQLEWVLSQYLGRTGVRRSMLQATTFDPARDHVPDAQLGFPCLQQVSFVPTDDGGLVVNAFYATQQLFHRAYGNHLGIAQLGAFMAREMKLRLARVNITVGIEKLDRPGKTSPHLVPLTSAARACLSPAATPARTGALAVA